MWARARRVIGINLALQGGGAHGAFTWGVLDRLLDEDDLSLAWISATSAGAVNAVAMADGLAEGGREMARAKLRALWEAVVKAGMPELIRLNPFLYGLSRSTTMAQMASLWSPSDLNPLRLDPFRELLEQHINFPRIRAKSPVELMIAATVVATGATRFFRRHEMTADAVLASACLPTLHHTVIIDGVAYWDGGFSANPDIVNLALESPVRDTLIVQLNPLSSHGVPTQVREITEQINALTFNAPLLRDVQLIEAVREQAASGWRVGGGGRLKLLAQHRFHLIEAGHYTASLGPETKIKPDAGLFAYLHGAGRTEAHKWLAQHKADIGKRETVDLAARYLRPVPEVARSDGDAASEGAGQTQARKARGGREGG